MNKFSFLLVLISCSFASFLSAQSLRINEVSQGPSGSKEYVELLVTGPALTNCSDQPQCLDLRGWILDDNNGYFSNGDLTGTGLAAGAIRFSNMPFWSCINPGTIILIYNDNDQNASVPAIDQDINDGNCTLILPVSSGLFERHDSAPNNSSMLYSTTGWVSGGSWTPISMANGDDSFQIYDPANTTVPVHGVSWGNNNSNNFIYFGSSAAGTVFSATSGTDLSLQANWTSAPAASGQTPGVPNSTANAALVGGMNLNCSAPLVVTVNPVDATCAAACSGSATVDIEGGQAPYNTPVWSNGTTAAQVTGLCAGNYSVEVTDANGCTTTETFAISSGTSLAVTTSGNVTICPGQSTTISASGATSYSWDNGLGAGSSFTVSPAATTTYNVTGTSGGCTATASLTVTVNTTLQVSAGSDQTVCAGANVTLTATGATTYVWNNGVTNGVAFVPPAGSTVYTVTGTSGSCSGTSSVTVTSNPIPVVSAGTDQSVCAGGSVTLNGSGAGSYTWDNGVTNGVAFTPAATGIYTVTGTTNGCSATDQVTVTVTPLPVVNAGTDQAVCSGASVTLTATGATSYSWDQGVVNGQPFSPANGSLVYTVTGTSNGCTATDQVTVTVSPTPQVNAGSDVWACSGNVVVLTATGAATYIWDNNITNGVGFIPSTGTITYTVTGTTNGCSATDQVVVTVGDPINVDAGPDLVVCTGESITLTATGATDYTWAGGSITNGQPFVPADVVNVYTVSGVTGVCIDQDEVIVTVADCGWELEMPNVFTPNGDNQNDLFIPVQQLNITVKQFRIFNRWGNALYESDAPNISWNGKAQSGTQATNGTYFYTLTFLDGSQKEQNIQGFFNLIAD